MAALFGGVWVLIWIVALTKILSGVTGAGKKYGSGGSLGSGSSSGNASASRSLNTPSRTTASSVKKLGKASSGASQGTAAHVSGEPVRLSNMSGMIEDRQNDWLARQLREEEWITKHSKLDLGAAHERECAADEVKIRRNRRK